jgi:hypothetical protein
MQETKKKQALGVLKQRENLTTEEFIDKARAVTAEDALVFKAKKGNEFQSQKEFTDYQKRVGYLSTLAFTLLYGILRKPSALPAGPGYPYTKRVGEEIPGEKSTALQVASEKEGGHSTALQVASEKTVVTSEKSIEPASGEKTKGDDKSKSGGYYKQVNQPPALNYYQVLGVNEDATPEEIRGAYRNIARRVAPDVAVNENELLKQGLTKSEIKDRFQRANDELAKVNEAYAILGGRKNKIDYDKVRKEKAESQTGNTHQPKTTGGASQPQNVAITLTPTIPENKEVLAARERTKDFRAMLTNAGGTLNLQPEEIKLLQIQGHLPEGIQAPAIDAAVNFHTNGGDAIQLAIATEKSKLSKEMKVLVERDIVYTAGALQESKLTPHEDLRLAAQTPMVSIIEEVPTSYQAQPNQMVYQREENAGGSFLQDEALSRIQGGVKGKATNLIQNQLQLKGLSTEAIKKGAQQFATKIGTKIATKIGVSAAVTAAATAIAPVIGTAIALVADKIIGLLKKGLNKLLQVLGLEKLVASITDKAKKGLSYAIKFAIGSIVYLLLTPAIYFLVSTLVVTVGFIIAVPLILLIITNSAYVVPEYTSPYTNPGTIGQSQYMQITKTARPSYQYQNSQLTPGFEVTYTITISALQGSLTNLNYQYECHVVNRAHTPQDCPALPANFPPAPPQTINSGSPVILTYTQLYREPSDFEDSIITDTFTVSADVQVSGGGSSRETSAGTATITIGTPPASSCPNLAGGISSGSYRGNVNPETGHGSNSYWGGPAGADCNFRIPWPAVPQMCEGPDISADPDQNNVCHTQTHLCPYYGFAIDSPASPGTPVYLPSMYGETLNWTFVSRVSINGGSWGYGYTYRANSSSGTSYQIYLGHLNFTTAPATATSGTSIGTMYPLSAGAHVHIELMVNGEYVRPDFLCGGGTPPPPQPLCTTAVNYGTSAGGRVLSYYRLGNGANHRAIVGGIHGFYEANTTSLVQNMLSYLCNNPTLIPSNMSLYIIPNANPDGYATGSIQLDPGRYNSNGVDLNRNWNYNGNWRSNACYNQACTTCVNAGTAAYSEPETSALRNLLTGNGIHEAIFYHSAANGIFYGGLNCEAQSYELAHDISSSSHYGILQGWNFTGVASDSLSAMGISTIEIELSSHTNIDWDRNINVLNTFLGWTQRDGGCTPDNFPPPPACNP